MATSLDDIDGVGPATLKKLKVAGVENLEDLLHVDYERLLEVGLSEYRAESLIQAAKENAVTIESAVEREEVYLSREHISTGIPALDESLDGGWEEEGLIVLYGKSGSGKTQLGHFSCVKAVEQTGVPAVYIETEKDRFRPERLRDFAEDESVLENIHVLRANDIDSQENAYKKAMNSFDETSLIVVDSFNNYFRRAFLGRGEFSSRSQVMLHHMDLLEEMAGKLRCPVLLCAQIYDSPEMRGRSDIPHGGNVFLHAVNYMVHLKHASGDLRVATIKNHPSKAESQTELSITATDIIGSRA